ncbi:MAG: hypothetical protein LBF42_02105 [Puniceicoccales bacterium]|jgi:hypothetical protein|nr:hypothetical protein [Puniceicoccales bacterium]
MFFPKTDRVAFQACLRARHERRPLTREQLIWRLNFCVDITDTHTDDFFKAIEDLLYEYGFDESNFREVVFPVRLFEGENLEKFRLRQIYTNPGLVGFLQFLPNRKCIELLKALFTYPAQRPGLGSCARSSYLINLWINNPLEYLKFAKQCLDDPRQVKFNVELGDTIEEIPVLTGLTDAHGKSLSDVMECAVSNLSLALDADGTEDRLERAIRNRITQWGGEKKNSVALKEYGQALKCVMNAIKRIYNPEDGEFYFRIDKDELMDAIGNLFGKLEFSSGEATPAALIAFIVEKTSESAKGLTYDYLNFITSNWTDVEIGFVQDGRISLAEAVRLVSALRDGNGREFVTLARIQTIDGETGKSSSGHGFNVRVISDFDPQRLQDGQILNIGLSNYADESTGRPYVGLRRESDGTFQIVNYHPERKEVAEPMAGTGSLLIKGITISPATFIEQG